MPAGVGQRNMACEQTMMKEKKTRQTPIGEIRPGLIQQHENRTETRTEANLDKNKSW